MATIDEIRDQIQDAIGFRDQLLAQRPGGSQYNPNMSDVDRAWLEEQIQIKSERIEALTDQYYELWGSPNTTGPIEIDITGAGSEGVAEPEPVDENIPDIVGEPITEISQQPQVPVRNAAIEPVVLPQDWRFRLKLAKSADYLYKSEQPGILAPLAKTDGVIFPYLPRVDMIYHSNYHEEQLPHSNWKGYFYHGSSPGDIILDSTFTAQDNYEATYMLAVIHFFKSVGKMFYGQDEDRGVPPPIMFLSGLGKYQYNNHPVVLKEFNYQTPDDVDYIRVDPGYLNNAAITKRTQSKAQMSANPFTNAVDRLKSIQIRRGGVPEQQPPQPSVQSLRSEGDVQNTYVPSLIKVTLTLAPIQNKDQISKEFSLKDYANGTLITRGFF